MRSFRIDDGRASVAARFIDTPKRRQDAAARAVVSPGFGTPARPGAVVDSPDAVNAANTSVLPVGKELWALWEGGSATVLDAATLETKGIKTLRPDLAHMPFLAHPRVEPDGRIWNLGLGGKSAFIYRLAADGSLEAGTTIPLPRASYVHDFTATDRHLVIVLQPWTVAGGAGQAFVSNLRWKPEDGVQVLVVDKADLSKRRIYELPAFFFFHMGDAWADQDGAIRFDICIDPDPDFAVDGARMMVTGEYRPMAPTQLALVTLRPDGRAELQRTGVTAEFPSADPRYAGQARRYTVHASTPEKGRPLLAGLAVQDWRTGRSRRFDYGARQVAEEAVFVARPGATAEFDGWLVAPTVNLAARATELHVFDARHVDDGPLCTWRADVVLPAGFHGRWAA